MHDDIQQILNDGAQLYEDGYLDEAIEKWKDALRADPGNEVAVEYLRFVSEHFQIEVESFIQDHLHPAPSPPPAAPPPSAVIPPPPPAKHESLAPADDVDELDWSELLNGNKSLPPPPEPALSTELLSPTDLSAGWNEGEEESFQLADDPMSMSTSELVEDTPRRSIEKMSDDSLDAMLGEDFKAWEEGEAPPPVGSTPPTLAATTEDEDEALMNLLSEGLQRPPPSGDLLDVSLSISDPPEELDFPLSDPPADPFALDPLQAPPRSGLQAPLLEAPSVDLGPPSSEPPLDLTPSFSDSLVDLGPPLSDPPIDLGPPLSNPPIDLGPPLSNPPIDLGPPLSDPPIELGPPLSNPPPSALGVPVSEESLELDPPSASFDPLMQAPPVEPEEAPIDLGAPLSDPPIELGAPLSDPPIDLGAPLSDPPIELAPPISEPPIALEFQQPSPQPRRGALIPEPPPPPLAVEEAAILEEDAIDFSAPLLGPEEEHAFDFEGDFDVEFEAPSREGIPAQPTPAFSRPRATPLVSPPTPPRSAPPRSASPRSASPRSASPRSASPRSASPRSASPRSAPPRSAPPRSARSTQPARPSRPRSVPAQPARPRSAPAQPARSTQPARPQAAPGQPNKGRLNSEVVALLSGLDDLAGGEAPRSEPPRPEVDINTLAQEAHQRAQRGDFEGGLRIIDQIFGRDPESRAAEGFLRVYATQATQVYKRRLGNLERAPRLKVSPAELQRRALNHRAGFLLSQVDGMTSLEELILISGMPEVEASRLLLSFQRSGLITFGRR